MPAAHPAHRGEILDRLTTEREVKANTLIDRLQSGADTGLHKSMRNARHLHETLGYAKGDRLSLP